jgi:hypothetical protein
MESKMEIGEDNKEEQRLKRVNRVRQEFGADTLKKLMQLKVLVVGMRGVS